MPRLDVESIAADAPRLGAAVAKRLGWVLERLGIEGWHLDALAALPIKGYRNLDPTGPSEGSYNGRWMLRENLPGMTGV